MPGRACQRTLPGNLHEILFHLDLVNFPIQLERIHSHLANFPWDLDLCRYPLEIDKAFADIDRQQTHANMITHINALRASHHTALCREFQ